MDSIYKDYWDGMYEEREAVGYYQSLYTRHLGFIKPEGKILDVGGGNGHLLRFLRVKKADIIDISDSGVSIAKKSGYHSILGDIEKPFPAKPGSYDTAMCFEVLEHLHHPEITIAEMHRCLKRGGILYLGQPNNKADGKIHVRRVYYTGLVKDLRKAGFQILETRFTPAFIHRKSLSGFYKEKNLMLAAEMFAGYILSFIPDRMRSFMARSWPNRFALMYIIKCKKI